MLMTEKEAKTKWCPLARVMNTKGYGGGNRWDGSGGDVAAPFGSTCETSFCMAWRWGDPAPYDVETTSRNIAERGEHREIVVQDDRFVELLATAKTDDEVDAIWTASREFIAAWKPTPPDPETGYDDEVWELVTKVRLENAEPELRMIAVFKPVSTYPRGYCGAFGKPEV